MRKFLSSIGASTVALILVMLILGATVVGGFLIMSNDRRDLIATNQALINQVKALGGTPKVSSPTKVVHGADGAAGATGPRGATGPQGPKGDMGVRGQTGADGPPGKDGAAGAKGDAGATGAAGTAGKDGAQGSTGAQGPQGDPGPAGPPGADGAAGATGATGPAGADGRSVSSVACVMGDTGTAIAFYDQTGALIGQVGALCTPS
jgi:hypothetical protein